MIMILELLNLSKGVIILKIQKVKCLQVLKCKLRKKNSGLSAYEEG